MNTAEFLTIAASMVPDRDVLTDPDDSCTYLQLQSRVNRLAQALQALGVGRGKNVGIMGVNSNAFVELYYATSTVGATFVPLNYRAKTEELSYMIDTGEVNVLFISERYFPLLQEIRSSLKTVERVYTLGFSADELQTLEQLRDQGADEPVFTEIDEDDPSLVIYTSGTTALPKGVVLTHRTLSAYVLNTTGPRRPGGRAGDHTGGGPLLPHRRGHHDARVAVQRPQARDPAAVRPLGVAGDR